MENVQKCSVKGINTKQKKAIEMLIYQGLSKSETAEVLNIAPQTLSRWLNPTKNPEFVEVYEKEIETAENMRKRNYKAVAQKAQEKLIELIDSSDEKIAFRACQDILDRAGDKPAENVNVNGVGDKLSEIFNQIGGEGLEE
ncbi:MAG: phBC6A51 family helix-turn-helix protein [Acutalibacteraceae bacterium]|nr:phBC6A51 family helix-turn-helix protein [Acutalibacteraceae bacterium]